MNKLELLELIFVFAGGLGMFLYGMNMMGEGLQKSAGNKLKRLLGYLTNNRLMAVLLGVVVTRYYSKFIGYYSYGCGFC